MTRPAKAAQSRQECWRMHALANDLTHLPERDRRHGNVQHEAGEPSGMKGTHSGERRRHSPVSIKKHRDTEESDSKQTARLSGEPRARRPAAGVQICRH